VALTVVKGTFAWRTTTGDTVISGLTDPKVIILWTTGGQTAAGVVTNQSTRWSLGFGTYRGGSVQQGYVSCWMTDANTSAIYGESTNTDAILRRMASDTTIDAEYDLVSMDSTSVTLNCPDASSQASLVHYLILGGSDITDAEAHAFAIATASATQDISLGSGMGNPGDGEGWLSLFSAVARTSTGTGGGDIQFAIGAATSDTERAVTLWGGDDGGGNMNCALWQKARALVGFTGSVGTADYEADLASSGHPTDGYRLSFADQAASANRAIGVAIRGDFGATIGTQATRTTTGDQDIAAGFSETIRGALLFGHSEPGSTSPITSGTSLGNVFVGGTDLTTEGASGFGDDDGLGFNNSLLNTSTTQAAQCYGHTGSENGSSLKYAADASVSGTNLRLTYTTADGTAREFCYLILGDAPAGGAEGSSTTNLTMGFTTSATVTSYGATTTPLTAGFTTSGKDVAYSSSLMPLAMTFTTSGEITVPPVLGAAQMDLTIGFTTGATSKAYGASTTPLTVGFTTVATSKAYGASTLPLVLGITTSGKEQAVGASATALTIAYTTGANSKAYASTTTPLLFGFTTTGTSGATVFGAFTLALTAGFTTSAQVTSYGASTLPLALSVTTGAKKTAYGASTLPLTWAFTTGSLRISYGLVLLPLTMEFTTEPVGVTSIVFFGPPSPGGGIIGGTPGGGARWGTPESGSFGPPSPKQVRT
jgi:hypothetical protein